MVAGSFLIWSRPLSLALSPASDFWNTEPPESWTPEQVEEITSKSPWAKPVSAQIRGYSPLSGAGAGRSGGGRRGGGGTVPMGRSAGANSGEGSPKFTGVVRWASAKPIRLALKLQFPPSLAEHFVISVSGLPIVSGHGGDDGAGGDSYDGLKAQTSLQVQGQEAVQPGVIEPDKNETSTLYFGFLPQMIQLDREKTVTFATTIAPLNVKVKFETKEMKFKGELAL